MTPSLPLDELRARYEALGPIEELSGERTYLGRCNTFARFLENGQRCAAYMRYFDRYGEGERERGFHPALAALLVEAWPIDPPEFADL
jgi:hypothetical protein